METVLNILHVVGAVFIVGPMAILPMTALRALRAGSPAQAATIAKSVFIFSLASLVVAVLGFGLVGVADPKYHLSIGTPWVLISLIAYVIAVALSLFVVTPALRKAIAASGTAGTSGTSGAVGTGKVAGYGGISASSGVVSLLLLLVVVLMVWKP
jgi:uncharacterized membrane protein